MTLRYTNSITLRTTVKYAHQLTAPPTRQIDLADDGLESGKRTGERTDRGDIAIADPIVASTSLRFMASKIDSRVFSRAHTAANPEALRVPP